MSIAMGAALNISSIGSSINSFLSPLLYSITGGIEDPLIAGFLFCVMSFVCVMILNIMDKVADKKERADDS